MNETNISFTHSNVLFYQAMHENFTVLCFKVILSNLLHVDLGHASKVSALHLCCVFVIVFVHEFVFVFVFLFASCRCIMVRGDQGTCISGECICICICICICNLHLYLRRAGA